MNIIISFTKHSYLITFNDSNINNVSHQMVWLLNRHIFVLFIHFLKDVMNTIRTRKIMVIFLVLLNF